jgi:phosphoribosylformylglycinamidine (FGAM) synthase-like amidotransferase family enzyme
MKLMAKIAALAALLTSSAAMAAVPQAVAEACCAIGVCCGMLCC